MYVIVHVKVGSFASDKIHFTTDITAGQGAVSVNVVVRV